MSLPQAFFDDKYQTSLIVDVRWSSTAFDGVRWSPAPAHYTFSGFFYLASKKLLRTPELACSVLLALAMIPDRV
jgi:hypothetical protein